MTKRWNYLSLNKLEICSACLVKRREESHCSKKTIYETRIVKTYIEIKRKVFMGTVYEAQCWKNEEITQISVRPNKTSVPQLNISVSERFSAHCFLICFQR